MIRNAVDKLEGWKVWNSRHLEPDQLRGLEAIIAELRQGPTDHDGRTGVVLDSIEEQLRALEIKLGISRPEPTIEDMRAETIALRARNDQADAERKGRHRTYD